MTAPRQLLAEWLAPRVAPEAAAWLEGQLRRLARDGSERDLVLTLGLIPRRLGKADLDLSAAELAAAAACRPGWDPSRWSVDTAARVLALLSLPDDDEAFASRFAGLCRDADAGEAIALYSGLPLYPGQPRLEAQAGEGLRGNIRAVFEAIAHRNPFPREQFDEHRWNHMVLKALFVGSSLAPIQGLDERANPELARILCDYAHERWAAGRPVSPELWRCVGPFADGPMLADLERAAASSHPRDRAAAALALAASPAPGARAVLDRLRDEADRIAAGKLAWADVA